MSVEGNWEEHHHKNEVLITNETIQYEEAQKTNWGGGREVIFFLFVCFF
jgi:hypothetical protein